MFDSMVTAVVTAIVVGSALLFVFLGLRYIPAKRIGLLEALLALLLSERLAPGEGAAVATNRSPETEALRQEVRKALHGKPA